MMADRGYNDRGIGRVHHPTKEGLLTCSNLRDLDGYIINFYNGQGKSQGYLSTTVFTEYRGTYHLLVADPSCTTDHLGIIIPRIVGSDLTQEELDNLSRKYKGLPFNQVYFSDIDDINPVYHVYDSSMKLMVPYEPFNLPNHSQTNLDPIKIGSEGLKQRSA